MMAATLIVFIKRRAGMEPAAFSHYWRDVHAPLLLACEDFSRHIVRYEQYHETAQLAALSRGRRRPGAATEEPTGAATSPRPAA